MTHPEQNKQPLAEEQRDELLHHQLPQRLSKLQTRTVDTSSLEAWLHQESDHQRSQSQDTSSKPIRFPRWRYAAAAAIVFGLLGLGVIYAAMNRPEAPSPGHHQLESSTSDWASIYNHSKEMKTHLVPASNMSEVNSFFQSNIPSLTDLPEVDHINDHRCCLITTEDGKVALLRVQTKYGPLTIAQAEHRQMNLPGTTRNTTIAGLPATFSQTPDVNMLVIQINGQYLCFMGQLTDEQLREVAKPFLSHDESV